MRTYVLRSIRSPGARRAPALALMEVLIAAAILASAAVLFLQLLVQARFDLARAQRQDQALALAQSLLQSAPAGWESAPPSGETGSASWTRRCAIAPFVQSPRLLLLQCRAVVQDGQDPPVALDTAFAIARAGLLQP